MRRRSRVLAVARTVLPLVVVGCVLGCTSTVAGVPGAGGSVVTKTDPDRPEVDPSFVHNTDGGQIDRLAATVVTDVQEYWRQAFPVTFGQDWRELSGGYYSVDTADADAEAPPCVKRSTEVEGNAFYCPPEDVIAWDRAALLPVLRERFGEAAVMLVLAHEIGHAVQYRAGLTTADRRADPDRFPTILIEAQADCYAGAFVRWVADGRAVHLRTEKDQLDAALESLISFRDPIGTEQTDQGAHGDAFDRVSAFQDGFDNDARLCAAMSVGNRTFTQRGFLSGADAARGGNVRFEEFVNSVKPSLDTYFSGLAGEGGAQWRQPAVVGKDAKPTCTAADQGPVAFCPDTGEINFDGAGQLPRIHTDIGDYATGTLLASRYAIATMVMTGKPPEGADTQRAVVCLAGSFTKSLFTQQLLSPGDLDEAIQVLLDYDYAARDTAGNALAPGFDRVTVFRQGFTQGGASCGLG